MVKILVVDDEEDTRTFVKDALESEGYVVDCAAGGTEGVAQILKEKYSLVLLDMFMPGLSGREVFDQILADPYTRDTRVAFFTIARLSQSKKSELLKLGVVDYIQKPIDAGKLVLKVKKLVGKA